MLRQNYEANFIQLANGQQNGGSRGQLIKVGVRITFTNRNINSHYKMYLGNLMSPQASSVKYLGMYPDKRLTQGVHRVKMKRKQRRKKQATVLASYWSKFTIKYLLYRHKPIIALI